ncbi:MAG: hypothetical protein KJO32_15955 [Deltaproteobacteria bacterium]|nr:hypothetical protein [Deltaproteobacteria bacterium]
MKVFSNYGSSGYRVFGKGKRMLAVPHSVPLSSGASGGTRRQTCLSVSEFLVSHHWRAAQGSPQGRYRSGCPFLYHSFGQAKE